MITASFTKELTELLNKHSIDSLCETPDYLLADFLTSFLNHLQLHNRAVTRWKGQPSLIDRFKVIQGEPTK